MSCCSKKRLELTREFNPKTKLKKEHSIISKKKVFTKFRYTGNNAWIFRGTLTRARYHFKHKGHTIMVDPQDAPAAQAEPLLESVP